MVINAAAYTVVDQAATKESLAVAINGEGAGHVAKAADRIGALLLQHVGQSSVFSCRLRTRKCTRLQWATASHSRRPRMEVFEAIFEPWRN